MANFHKQYALKRNNYNNGHIFVPSIIYTGESTFASDKYLNFDPPKNRSCETPLCVGMI